MLRNCSGDKTPTTPLINKRAPDTRNYLPGRSLSSTTIAATYLLRVTKLDTIAPNKNDTTTIV
jgi:hypothetical protein